MKNEAAQAKSEGQHIHGAFHTRQVHTSCKWGHTKMAHTPLQTIQPGKARKHTGGLQDPRKTIKNEAAQAK